MTLRQLEIFKAIVDTGRFTAAAQRLYVAQPSVTQQIQLLEQELGEPLFIRQKNRKVEMTEAGIILNHHAELILRECQMARMEISALSREPVGQIRIGLGGHQLATMLLPVLSAFRKRFAKVSVDLVNGTTPHLLDLLKTNRLDLAVVNFPVEARELRNELLFNEELVVVVQSSDPLASRKSISPADISSLPLVLYDQSTSTRQRLDAFFRKEKIEPNVVFELSSVELMKKMVEMGLGATVIPASAVLADSSHDGLRALRIRGKPLTRGVGVSMPVLQRMPKVVEVLLQLIRERFEQIKASLVA